MAEIDVAVVGGGPAGTATAIALDRIERRVIGADIPTPRYNNGRDYTSRPSVRSGKCAVTRRPVVPRSVVSCSVALLDLHEVAAGVLEDGGGHGAHGDWRLSEIDSQL